MRLFGCSNKLYKNIDELPLWNWIKCQEEKTTIYVLKRADYEGIKESKQTQLRYIKLSDEMFNEFGFTDKFKEYISLKKRILLKRLDAYVKEDKTLLTLAKMEEIELKKKFENGLHDTDYWYIIASLEQATGLQFDVKTMSVKSFYKHLYLHIEKLSHQTKWLKK